MDLIESNVTSLKAAIRSGLRRKTDMIFIPAGVSAATKPA